MDLFLIRVFQRQVADQCRIGLYGAALLSDGLQNAVDQDTIWIGMQTLLTGAGNVSKALWGSGGKLEAERQPLRESLGVSDTSPLRDVNMRNNFEHYDERLDRWWNESSRHNHFDRYIGPLDAIGAIDDLDRFRQYDPATKEMAFWGQRFDVQTIETALGELLPRAEFEAAKPHWETRVDQ